MTAFVYLFSRFTSEALLLEALLICALTATYAAFWVLRKRRHGAIRTEVPAGVVKVYLNELIANAEQVRVQLFGLLSAAGIPAHATLSAVATPAAPRMEIAPLTGASAVDPQMAEKLAAFEARMQAQAQAMEAIVAEKARIETELTQARAAGGAAAPADTVATGQVIKLQEKVRGLEGKLAEYSVIEDDLANLKRLQQENAQLKAALGGKAGAMPEATAPAPAPSAAQETPAIATAAPEVSFDALVGQVEESLQGSAPEPEPAPRAPAPGPSVADTSAFASPAQNPSVGEKSDADLVAEFEKMLNG